VSALVKKLVSVVTALFSVLGCGHPSERLETASVASKKMGREMPFAVLRAPGRTGHDPKTLPVVVFLHGMGGKHTDFDRYAVSDAVNSAMESGDVPSAHLIFPNGERGFYLNWYDGTMPYEDYILEEVIPEAENMLGVSPNREQRHIAGVSMV
jgi:S-formylglutathione hydrolase FrmB